jgi:hypothetical protein
MHVLNRKSLATTAKKLAAVADADIEISCDNYKKDLNVHGGVTGQKATRSEGYPART